MMVLLSKREYDELVQKASAVELLAEQKAEAMKQQIKTDLTNACKDSRFDTVQSFADKLLEILRHY